MASINAINGRKKQHVRVTKKALESRQFATVRYTKTHDFDAGHADIEAVCNDAELCDSANLRQNCAKVDKIGKSRAQSAREMTTLRCTRVSGVGSKKVSSSRSRSGESGGAEKMQNGVSLTCRNTDAETCLKGKQSIESPFLFDPIPSDPMFEPVEKSVYWPPPNLSVLQLSTGISVVGSDGFDSYDRREDDKHARSKSRKIVKGELNHPRGKERCNTVIQLDSDDGDKDA